MSWGKKHRLFGQSSKILNPFPKSPESQSWPLSVIWLAGGGPRIHRLLRQSQVKTNKQHPEGLTSVTASPLLSSRSSWLHHPRNSRAAEYESQKGLFPLNTVNVLWKPEVPLGTEVTRANLFFLQLRIGEGGVGFRPHVPPFLTPGTVGTAPSTFRTPLHFVLGG